jgi:hypothetical protein
MRHGFKFGVGAVALFWLCRWLYDDPKDAVFAVVGSVALFATIALICLAIEKTVLWLIPLVPHKSKARG